MELPDSIRTKLHRMAELTIAMREEAVVNKPVMEMNNIYNMDCLQGMAQITPGSIDMILCDLPYGTTQNKWDSVIPLEPLWEQYWRICKLNAAVVLTSMQPFTTTLIQSARCFFKYCWVWDKANSTGFLNSKKQPLRQTEDVCVFYREQPIYNPQMVVRGRPRTKGGYNKPGGSENYGDFHATKTRERQLLSHESDPHKQRQS